MRLTAHPLQRIGAYALACLADLEHPDPGGTAVPDPQRLDAAGFDAAVATMTADAVRAALIRDTKSPAGFFLKCSYSLFPNSKMNQPGNKNRSDDEIVERIRQWRGPVVPERPDVNCVLCGHPSAGFFGKTDVPLVESGASPTCSPRRPGRHRAARTSSRPPTPS